MNLQDHKNGYVYGIHKNCMYVISGKLSNKMFFCVLHLYPSSLSLLLLLLLSPSLNFLPSNPPLSRLCLSFSSTPS